MAPRLDSAADPSALAAATAGDLCRQVLALAGVGPADAEVVADTLVDASLRGVDSHGLALLPTYVERLRSGQMRPGRTWIVRRDTPAAALCDGQGGLGPVLARRACDLAAAKARAAGVGCVVLRDGNYVGALGYYARRLAQSGAVALVAANASPRVAPHGGRSGLHGTNPLAWAAPVEGGPPLVFDSATGYSAARVARAAEAGHRLPAGVALDAQGRPTRDAAAALDGTLLPVGGPLGYGLGLLVDVLTAGLAASPVGRQVPPAAQLDGPHGCSFTALALDPEALGGAGALASSAAQLVVQARAVSPVEGGGPVRVPGDRAQESWHRRVRAGIPIGPMQWDRLVTRLAAAGIGVSLAAGGQPVVASLPEGGAPS